VPAVNIGVLDAVLCPTTILGKLHKVYFVDLPVRLSEVLGVNDCTGTYDTPNTHKLRVLWLLSFVK